MKILFTGGGTAGHISPIIAIAREIKKMYLGTDLSFYYIGPKDSFGRILMDQEGIKVKTILAGKIRRYFGIGSFFENILDILFKIPIGIIQSLFYIFFLGPDLIFSKGGYGSLPAVISGKILWVPIFLHESDIVPGLTNRISGKLAKEIFVSFPIKRTEHFPFKKMIWVGNPVRTGLLEGEKEEGKELLKITGEKPVVLILGGSQGAQKINDMILEILPALSQKFEIIHQCGEKNFVQVETESKIMLGENGLKYYHLVPFLKEEQLKDAYAVSDIIASRAGASSIFEIAAIRKPSILIPLTESAQNHQLKNAYAYAENGACLVIEESNLTPHFFLDKLEFLTDRPNEMEKMRLAAESFSKPQAAKIIGRYILDYLF